MFHGVFDKIVHCDFSDMQYQEKFSHEEIQCLLC